MRELVSHQISAHMRLLEAAKTRSWPASELEPPGAAELILLEAATGRWPRRLPALYNLRFIVFPNEGDDMSAERYTFWTNGIIRAVARIGLNATELASIPPIETASALDQRFDEQRIDPVYYDYVRLETILRSGADRAR